MQLSYRQKLSMDYLQGLGWETAVDGVYALKQRPREKAMNLNISSEDRNSILFEESTTLSIELVASFYQDP